jgi:hypothetical protein
MDQNVIVASRNTAFYVNVEGLVKRGYLHGATESLNDPLDRPARPRYAVDALDAGAKPLDDTGTSPTGSNSCRTQGDVSDSSKFPSCPNVSTIT